MNIYHIMKALEKRAWSRTACSVCMFPRIRPLGRQQIQPGPLMAGMFSFHVRLQGAAAMARVRIYASTQSTAARRSARR